MDYGTAVFEGIRVYGTSGGVSLFRLDAHLARLIASAAKFGIEVPWTEDDIAGACVETVRASGRSQGYIRPPDPIRCRNARPWLTRTSRVDDLLLAVGRIPGT